MGAVAKLAAQVTEGKSNKNLASPNVESFPLNGGKDFNKPRDGEFNGFCSHVKAKLI